jgi:hypothetical protein
MHRVRWALLIAGMLALLTACGSWPFGSSQLELVEAEIQQVDGCEQVGALSETIDTGKIITPLARRRMVERLEARAQGLGGTHLVWVYRTDQTAAARVFRCPQ